MISGPLGSDNINQNDAFEPSQAQPAMATCRKIIKLVERDHSFCQC